MREEEKKVVSRGKLVRMTVGVHSDSDIDGIPSRAVVVADRAQAERIVSMSRLVREAGANYIQAFDSTPRWGSGKGRKGDVSMLTVGRDEFFWSAYLDHSDPPVQFETNRMPVSELCGVLGIFGVDDLHAPDPVVIDRNALRAINSTVGTVLKSLEEADADDEFGFNAEIEALKESMETLKKVCDAPEEPSPVTPNPGP